MYRNPSPPPEILGDDNFIPDRIGSTVYSKRWLYKTLMNILKFVQENSAESMDPAEGDSLKEEKTMTADQDIIELDPQIEEDACTLWDMTANNEVAEFLCLCDVANIFLDIIEQTKSPRLLEITIGILGNISSFNSTCEFISKNKALLRSIVTLSGCTDSCTLAQLFRLLSCGVSKESSQKEWFNLFEENPFFMENLKGILENNLCRDVLKGLLEFLGHILNYSATYNCMWGQEHFALAVTECGTQLLRNNNHDDLDTFFSVLNTLCQASTNVQIYGKHFVSLRPIFHSYFTKLGEEEYLPPIARVEAISSTFALYGNLIFSGMIPPEHVILDISVLKSMSNMSKLVKNFLTNLKPEKASEISSQEPVCSVLRADEANGDTSYNEEMEQNWITLVEAITHAAKACFPFASQEDEIQILNEILSLSEDAENLVPKDIYAV